jgi:PAS domain S-box-containing protein
MLGKRMPDTPTFAKKLLGLWSDLLEREPRQRPLWMRWGFAVLVTVGAMGLRAWMGSPESGARFATLTLAAVLSGLYGGVAAGVLSTVLGLTLAYYFFIAPFGQLAVAKVSEAFWLGSTFLLTMLVILGAVGVMQHRNRRLQVLARQLRESQKKFHNTFDHAASGMTHVGLQGQLLDINTTFCELVGYSKEELSQMTFQDITVAEDLSLDLSLLEECFAGQRSQYVLDKRYRHKDGHEIWAQLTVALVRDAQGQPQYFISVVQDISKLKAAEEALRASERLMQQAQGVAGFITWEADIATQKFRTFSRSNRWLGLPDTPFGTDEIFNRVHPDDHERMLREWEAAIKGKGNLFANYRGHPSGSIAWFLVQASFERDENGRAFRAFGITQDISVRKLAELEIQRLNASLEQRIQERTEELKSAYSELESYSYAVAHDLRSPLRIINGFAQALEEDNPGLKPGSQSHIQRIKDSSRRMGKLIDGLLKLSQYTRGDVQRQPISITDIATRVLTELANDQPERKVVWSVAPNLLAQADPALIEAMLQNLLHNAWKYTAQATDAQIQVFQEEGDGEPSYCVKDNGAGFDMALASKLFQPFQRLHMPHEFEGLGVGLATARRIVQKHGGELRAIGAPGQGATFCFTLPGKK